MDQLVVPPSEQEYLEDLHGIVVELARYRYEMWWQHDDGSRDGLLFGDIELATAELIRGGLDRSRAHGLAHTFRYLDVRPVGPWLEDHDPDAPAFNFVRELRIGYQAIARRLESPDPSRLGPDCFELAVSLTDSFVRQEAIELKLVALDYEARLLAKWGYDSLDQRRVAMGIVAFSPSSTLAQRRRSLQVLCSPEDASAGRLTTPATNVTVPDELRVTDQRNPTAPPQVAE